ncbi:protein ECERIFERUM 26-like [Momordica charantia]|uniref:Protein ECERIFERUM 26-like n=1 Tax=Momordica charantia TaxID=3673 RepID=A0A6J1CCU1_MOMCH|nr:protein ECERIFERUM 26-like [Momordica charantia]
MVSGEEEQSLVYGVRISSVGPGNSIGLDGGYHLSGLDLAMKLHYIKGIYYFDGDASREVTVTQIKAATFVLFNDYYVSCGRFRREESGRPFIKCNDCGARFIEAECRKTVEEWLQMIGDDSSPQKLLVSDKVIGPELHFSPPVYMQVTRFKCRGISIGLSWAHVLGDAFSAAAFINSLAALLFGGAAVTPLSPPPPPPGIGNIATTPPPKPPSSAAAKPPLSLRRIDPVGDHWIPTNNSKMESFSFNLNATQLAQLQTQMPRQTPPFESIAAALWQSVANLRRGSEPTTVTLCKLDPIKQQGKIIGNAQKISTVKSGAAVSVTDRRELADLLVVGAAEEEGDLVEEAVERDNGVGDFIVYGANLTFVKWDEADFYGEEMGMDFERPKFVYYAVDGVGDSGAVVVVPGLGGSGGRFVTVILRENEEVGLKAELIANGMLL